MKNIFYDTSILSSVAWHKSGKSQNEIHDDWNYLLDQVENIIPTIFNTDYKWINTPLLFLEIIGLGTIKEKDQKKGPHYAFNSICLKKYLSNIDWENYTDPEKFIHDVIKQIELFINNELNPRNIRKQTLLFQRSYLNHRESHFLFAKIKKWAKTLNEPQDFMDLRNSFVWDSIFKFPFLKIATIHPKDRLPSMLFWSKVVGILLNEYNYYYQIDPTLESSTLGLFSEINRIGGFNKNNKNEWLLKPWADIVDSESINYALTGKRNSDGTNAPVIVITCDKITDIEKRIECLYLNIIELRAKGIKIDFCPGIIICFTLNSSGSLDRTIAAQGINIQEFIDKNLKKP